MLKNKGSQDKMPRTFDLTAGSPIASRNNLNSIMKQNIETE